jgi:predicted transcriptional regulator
VQTELEKTKKALGLINSEIMSSTGLSEKTVIQVLKGRKVNPSSRIAVEKALAERSSTNVATK